MKIFTYVLSNDAKWMENEPQLPFIPQVGTDLDGLADQPLRISGMSYDVKNDYIKLRLSWLSPDPLNSDKMVEYGWALKTHASS